MRHSMRSKRAISQKGHGPPLQAGEVDINLCWLAHMLLRQRHIHASGMAMADVVTKDESKTETEADTQTLRCCSTCTMFGSMPLSTTLSASAAHCAVLHSTGAAMMDFVGSHIRSRLKSVLNSHLSGTVRSLALCKVSFDECWAQHRDRI